jgi:hypothetical protein
VNWIPGQKGCTLQKSLQIHSLLEVASSHSGIKRIQVPSRLLAAEMQFSLQECLWIGSSARYAHPLSILIVQELLRLIDQENVIELLPGSVREKYRECGLAWQAHWSRSDECQRLLGLTRTFSDRPEFLSLINWEQNWRADRRAVPLLGVDPYSLAKPENFFVVNAAAYLLDPLYSCRRPDLAMYFSARMKKTFQSCGSEIELPFRKFKLESVYQVHYLLADEGSDLVSSFGHSMYRLVICAPWREAPGPECLSDTEFHVVVGFQAIVNASNYSVTQGYPSRLFVEPLSQTVERYSLVESRGLRSYVLELSPSELRSFLFSVSYLAFNYQTIYGFLTNNCATQALSLVKMAVHRPLSPLHWDHPSISTPNSLKNYLIQYRLLQDWKSAREQIPYVNFFPAISSVLDRVTSKIRKRYPDSYRAFEKFVLSKELVLGLREQILRLQAGKSADEVQAIETLAIAYAEHKRVLLKARVHAIASQRLGDFLNGLLPEIYQSSVESRWIEAQKKLQEASEIVQKEMSQHPLIQEWKSLNSELAKFSPLPKTAMNKE